jgi:hypothetical protein
MMTTFPPLVQHVVDQWPRVRISDLGVTAPVGQGELATVHARVELGALLPADVQVEVVQASGLGDRRRPAEACRRLCSEYAYHNDSYAYEGRVPVRELSVAGGCVVRVTPAPDLDRGAVRPVIRWVPVLETRPPIADVQAVGRIESGARLPLPGPPHASLEPR